MFPSFHFGGPFVMNYYHTHFFFDITWISGKSAIISMLGAY